MSNNRQNEARDLVARAPGSSVPPTRGTTSEEQSSVVRNPAPDSSPPSVPSVSRTFTVSC